MGSPVKELRKAVDAYLNGASQKRDFALARLWTHWHQALGPELGAMVKPVNYTETTLFLGVEDSQVMQEMVFYATEIQERIARFLGGKAFDKIQFELLNRRTPLSEIYVEQSYLPPGTLLKEEIRQDVQRFIGDLEDSIPAESSVGRCYRVFVRKFGLLRE